MASHQLCQLVDQQTCPLGVHTLGRDPQGKVEQSARVGFLLSLSSSPPKTQSKSCLLAMYDGKGCVPC